LPSGIEPPESLLGESQTTFQVSSGLPGFTSGAAALTVWHAIKVSKAALPIIIADIFMC